jgi:TetR/AcrR family transcriptional regulator, transcriptional repressor of bet genes
MPVDAAATYAIALTALVDGLWLELVLDPATFGPDGAIALVEQAVDAYFASARISRS